MQFSIYLSYLFIIFKSIYYCSANENQQVNANPELVKKKLIFAHILYRHGDRTPVEPYPTDPWKNVSYWPVGWGQLTNTGKEQQYELGIWLRKRYQKLLSKKYTKDEIYIRSTDVDRTLMSASANLAGLYPPIENDVWNKNVPWQPIPVHTVPAEDDNNLDKNCPAYDYAFKKFKQSEEYISIDRKFTDLYKYLTKYTGRTITSMFDVNKIHNCLFIEELYNKTLPGWTKSVFYPGSDMELATSIQFAMFTYTRELARLKGGFLLKEILDRCTNKTEFKLDPNRVMWMYSAHDTTVANLLNTLELFEFHTPPYRSCVLIELSLLKNIPYIQIFYKNTTNEPKPLYIPNCGILCPLNKMYQIYKDVLPGDWDTECHVSTLSMTYEDAEITSAMGFAIGIFTILLVIILIFTVINLWHRRDYPDSRWYLRIDD